MRNVVRFQNEATHSKEMVIRVMMLATLGRSPANAANWPMLQLRLYICNNRQFVEIAYLETLSYLLLVTRLYSVRCTVYDVPCTMYTGTNVRTVTCRSRPKGMKSQLESRKLLQESDYERARKDKNTKESKRNPKEFERIWKSFSTEGMRWSPKESERIQRNPKDLKKLPDQTSKITIGRSKWTYSPLDVWMSKVISVLVPGFRQLFARSAYLNSSSQTTCSERREESLERELHRESCLSRERAFDR